MGVNSNGTTMMDQGVFKNLGSVTWDTTAKTASFTAVSGNGYFVNTTSGAITVTLPATPSAGDIVGIKDYANTADTNGITIGRNGSNINGDAADYKITIEGLSALLVYVDATKGWLITNAAQANDISEPATYIVATGGTITCCGDFKIHTFTGPGTFTVSSVGNPLGGPNSVDYLVVAGGGSGGDNPSGGGGGGAGGYRTSFPSCGAGSIPVTATGYPITVGGGASVGGNRGSNSVFSTITSTGGGSGRLTSLGISDTTLTPGGSGGGGGSCGGTPTLAGGSGNTPPVSPPQGNNGGTGTGGPAGGSGAGGGGADSVGGNGTPGGTAAGAGGNGKANSITGSPVYYAGGGGGGCRSGAGNTPGPGGLGGGGDGGNGPSSVVAATPGTANTGGGGGGPWTTGDDTTGGSGIVIIRYKYQ